MPIDGLFIHYLIDELKPIVENSIIGKINQTSKNEIIFQIRNNYTNYQLYFNVDLEAPRVHISYRKFGNPITPYNFCMLLRKYLDRGIIKSIEQFENDRIICLTISSYNELQDNSIYHLYFELTGRSSNLILTNEHDIIIDAIRKFPPSETNIRVILPKAKYTLPSSNQINPFTAEDETFFNDLQGCSSDLKKEFNYIGNFKDVIRRKPNPIVYQGKKATYYCFPLEHKDENFITYSTISELLDIYFISVKEEINEEAAKLHKTVKREIDKRMKKLQNLLDDLTAAKDKLQSKDYGVLLQSYLYLIKKGDKKITVPNFLDDNKEITIELDPTKSAVENLEKFFKATKKAENAVIEVSKQISITKDEIEYLENIIYQIKFLNPQEIDEVREELLNNKFIFTHKKNNNSKKKRILIATYNLNGIEIKVGKNNIQNNLITHKLSKPNDYWFHVKDMPGSHVIVKTDQLNEEIIRFAANLAAYFSKGATSSSVPVDYTQVRYIKKIPGLKGNNVTYTNNKTIYIDPDNNKITNAKVTYK